MEKMLITGATGFLGRNFLECIDKEKYEVHIIQRGNQVMKGIWSHRADTLEQSQTLDIIRNVRANILVLFAWNVKSQSYWHGMENRKWVNATLMIAEQFLKLGGGKKYIVFAGTSASYDYSHGVLLEDKKMERPDTLYGISKLYTSDMLRFLAEQEGAQYMEARLFSIFGIYERAGRLITNTIESLRKNKLILNNKWQLERDYIYIKDAVRAIRHLIDLRAEGVYNISSGKAVRIEYIIKTIAQCMGKEDMVILSEFDGTGEHMLIQGDNGKLLNTGFHFRYSFEEAIREEIHWYTDTLTKETGYKSQL